LQLHFLFYRQCSMSKNVVSPNKYGSFTAWYGSHYSSIYLGYVLKAKNPGRNFLQWYYATIFIYVISFWYYYNFFGRVFILKGGICRYKWENVWVRTLRKMAQFVTTDLQSLLDNPTYNCRMVTQTSLPPPSVATYPHTSSVLQRIWVFTDLSDTIFLTFESYVISLCQLDLLCQTLRH